MYVKPFTYTTAPIALWHDKELSTLVLLLLSTI